MNLPLSLQPSAAASASAEMLDGIGLAVIFILAPLVALILKRRQKKRGQELTDNLGFILNAADLGTWEWSISANRITWSPELERVHGLEPGTFPGSFDALMAEIYPEDRDYVRHSIEDALAGKRPHHVEYRIQLPDGRIRWLEGRGKVLHDKQGRPARMIGVCGNITERKQFEERQKILGDAGELLTSSLDTEKTLQSLASLTVPRIADWCLIDMLDENGEIRRKALVHTGKPRQQQVAKHHENYPPSLDDAVGAGAVIRTGKAAFYQQFDQELLLKAARDPDHYDLLQRAAIRSAMVVPVCANEKVLGSMSFIYSEDSGRLYTDSDFELAQEIGRRAGLSLENAYLYERSQLAIERYQNELKKRLAIEEQLRQAKEAADAANNAKTNFLANMSHEIRTPLGAILGFSELLLADDQSFEERETSADAIQRNGQLLLRLVDEILDLARIEAGRVQIEKESVDLRKLIADIRGIMELKAHEKALTLNIGMDEALPKTIETDPVRLKQILINQVGNSIKFTDEGSVTVLVHFDEAASRVHFDVTDTGCGISPADADRLFEPFAQADTAAHRNHGGVGLGLALSRRLARLLGGDVKLGKSPSHEGSTFHVSIDAGRYTKYWADPSEKRRSATHRWEGALTGRSVLLVEDTPDNQMLITRILKRAGAAVTVASNGHQGIEILVERKGEFDLVLMDIRMPIMDGHTAARQIRSRGFHLPVVALTAHAMAEEKERCLAAGFNAHIPKPIDRATLIDTLTTHLGSAH